MEAPVLFTGFAWWHWCLAGIALMVLELFAPGVLLLWIGLGATATGLVVAAVGLGSWEAQCAVFVPFTFASLYLGRKFIKKAKPDENETLNRRSASYIGRKAVVVEAIENGKGRIRLGDSVWTARGADCPAGTRVTITGGSGIELQVVPDMPQTENSDQQSAS